RDLARYLNRNVSLVNQQLAIASAIDADLIGTAGVDESMVCRLAHVTLHRIAKLPAANQARALKEAIRMQERRPGIGVDSAPTTVVPQSAMAFNMGHRDQSEETWDRGGFRLKIREAIRDLSPARAEEYIRQLVPAFG